MTLREKIEDVAAMLRAREAAASAEFKATFGDRARQLEMWAADANEGSCITAEMAEHITDTVDEYERLANA